MINLDKRPKKKIIYFFQFCLLQNRYKTIFPEAPDYFLIQNHFKQKATLPSFLNRIFAQREFITKTVIIKLQSAQVRKQMAHLVTRSDLVQVNNSVLYYTEIRYSEVLVLFNLDSEMSYEDNSRLYNTLLLGNFCIINFAI